MISIKLIFRSKSAWHSLCFNCSLNSIPLPPNSSTSLKSPTISKPPPISFKATKPISPTSLTISTKNIIIYSAKIELTKTNLKTPTKLALYKSNRKLLKGKNNLLMKYFNQESLTISSPN